MQPDPTPAEIEAGVTALPSAVKKHPAHFQRTVADAVLRAVLPAHDARMRAKVAEEIAQVLAQEYHALVAAGLAVAATPYGHAAAIARAHTTEESQK